MLSIQERAVACVILAASFRRGPRERSRPPVVRARPLPGCGGPTGLGDGDEPHPAGARRVPGAHRQSRARRPLRGRRQGRAARLRGRRGRGDGPGDRRRRAGAQRAMAAGATGPAAATAAAAGTGSRGPTQQQQQQGQGPTRGGGLLDGGEPSEPWQPRPPGPPTAADDAPTGVGEEPDIIHTWLNAGLTEGGDLQVAQAHGFEVYLGERSSTAQAVAAAIIPIARSEESIDLTVQLVSSDFTVPPVPQTLTVGRSGASAGRARFDIVPLHAGPSTLTVTVDVKGNFLQRLDVTFDVGSQARPQPDVDVYGRPVAAAGVLGERIATLQFLPTAGGYQLIAKQVSADPIDIRITPQELAARINGVRGELLSTVQNSAVALNLDITAQDNATALGKLAFEGYLLFQSIFLGSGASPQLVEVGQWLLTREQAQRLHHPAGRLQRLPRAMATDVPHRRLRAHAAVVGQLHRHALRRRAGADAGDHHPTAGATDRPHPEPHRPSALQHRHRCHHALTARPGPAHLLAGTRRRPHRGHQRRRPDQPGARWRRQATRCSTCTATRRRRRSTRPTRS